MKRTDWKKKELHKNNSGYSMVELIIVVAIIALLVGAVFYSFILVYSANAKSCAHSIQRAIADCKVTTMGKADAYMELWKDTDGKVYTKTYVYDTASASYESSERQKVGNNRVYVAYVKEGETVDAATELTEGTTLTIRFDRASGSFNQDTYKDCAQILVIGGNRRYVIDMIKLTGKSSVETGL